MKSATLATAQNVIPLGAEKKISRIVTAPKTTFRFKISAFLNAGGSQSWRVSGTKRDGTRIRENFTSEDSANKRRIALEAEYHSRQESEYALRSTKLSDTQLRIAETVFNRLTEDDEILQALHYWLEHGKKVATVESRRLDEACAAFLEWLQIAVSLRPRTKEKLRRRIKMFCNSVPNHRVCDIGPEVIEGFLANRNVAPLTKVADVEVISRFFSWCMERPREWVAVNPCSKVIIEASTDKAPPAILTVEECEKLLAAAESNCDGKAAPYVAVCLFGGLRPTEADRLTWDKVNLTDREIRIEAQSSKRKQARVVDISDTLLAWLSAHKDKPFKPSRRLLDSIKQAAGYTGRVGDNAPADLKPWPPDVLRHTAISHRFRACGSYGLTADWAGNSEQVIRDHYKARVSSEETARFYAILPKKGGVK